MLLLVAGWVEGAAANGTLRDPTVVLGNRHRTCMLTHSARATWLGETRSVFEIIPQRKYQDCQACLGETRFGDVTYLALAKSGSRTLLEYLCARAGVEPPSSAWCEARGYSENCRWEHCETSGIHHCHLCTVADLQARGAKKLLVPLRSPTERYLSLVRFQLERSKYRRHIRDCLGTATAANLWLDAIRIRDHPMRFEALEMIQFFQWALIGVGYYFSNQSAPIDVQFLCVDTLGDDLVRVLPSPHSVANANAHYNNSAAIDVDPLSPDNTRFILDAMHEDELLYRVLCHGRSHEAPPPHVVTFPVGLV